LRFSKGKNRCQEGENQRKGGAGVFSPGKEFSPSQKISKKGRGKEAHHREGEKR